MQGEIIDYTKRWLQFLLTWYDTNSMQVAWSFDTPLPQDETSSPSINLALLWGCVASSSAVQAIADWMLQDGDEWGVMVVESVHARTIFFDGVP